MTKHQLRISTLSLAIMAVAACGQSPSATANEGAAATTDARVSAQPDSNLVAAQIADTLQACSYDGQPVHFGMGGAAPRDCRDMIAQVMNFTGLPQNFDVTEADVPNAAAAILLDPQKIPHRVIAFNPQFMELVRRETGGNPWAAVSIMAHEAGHHLAGHTIQTGGSQPPIELEADKFSGFVLYKMGASRNDALKAIETLVPDQVPGDSTHPARAQRTSAIRDGWDSACRQTARADCSAGIPGGAPAPGIATAVATTQSPVSRESVTGTGNATTSTPPSQPTMPASPRVPAPATASTVPAAPVVTAPSPVTVPAAPPAAGTTSGNLAARVVLPMPDPNALPSKGTQFIYDEYGVLDSKIVGDYERQLFDHARTHDVEIVTMLVKDLHGMTAEQYGWAMMRQLRVGKLDVGNGAVLVIAPDQGQVAAVMGPGIALEMQFHDKSEQLQRWIKTAWPLCQRAQKCGNWTDNLLLAADHIRRDTDDWDWTVRYQSLGEIQAQAAAETGQQVAPNDSKVWRKITRLTGTVEELAPKPGRYLNSAKLINGRKAVQVKTDDGLIAMLYLDPRMEGLMPGGALQAGKHYAFIGRESGLSHNPKDTQSIDLLSYVLAQ